MLDQGGDILSTFLKSRYFQGNNIEPEKKVFSEFAILYLMFQISVGGAYQPHVCSKDLASPHPLELSFLQKSEELDLYGGRQFADFVQEKATAVCLFKATDPPLMRACE